MARSAYIYVYIDKDGNLLGAFTVKHEALWWYERNNGRAMNMYRLRDGIPSGGLVQLYPATGVEIK